MPTQRTMYSTLEEIERRVADEGLRPPAVVVIGGVVAIAAETCWARARLRPRGRAFAGATRGRRIGRRVRPGGNDGRKGRDGASVAVTRGGERGRAVPRRGGARGRGGYGDPWPRLGWKRKRPAVNQSPRGNGTRRRRQSAARAVPARRGQPAGPGMTSSGHAQRLAAVAGPGRRAAARGYPAQPAQARRRHPPGLRHPRRRRGLGRAGQAPLPDRRLPAAPGPPVGRPDPRRPRRLHRGGQVDAGEQHRRHPGEPDRGATAHHELARARLPPRRHRTGSPRTCSCRRCRGSARRAWPGRAGTACWCSPPARG